MHPHHALKEKKKKLKPGATFLTMYDGNAPVGSAEYDSGLEKPALAEAEKAADPG